MKKRQQIIGNTLVEEYYPTLKKDGKFVMKLLEIADRFANLPDFTVAYIRLKDFQKYSEDRGISVYTDVDSLAIVKEDLSHENIRNCLIKGFYNNVDLTIIVDMQKGTIRFNRSRFSVLDTGLLVSAAVKQ